MTLLYVILFLTGVLGNLAVCLVIVRYQIVALLTGQKIISVFWHCATLQLWDI